MPSGRSLIALLKNGVGDNGNREGDDSEMFWASMFIA
jgi:hypothetical protein